MGQMSSLTNVSTPVIEARTAIPPVQDRSSFKNPRHLADQDSVQAGVKGVIRVTCGWNGIQDGSSGLTPSSVRRGPGSCSLGRESSWVRPARAQLGDLSSVRAVSSVALPPLDCNPHRECSECILVYTVLTGCDHSLYCRCRCRCRLSRSRSVDVTLAPTTTTRHAMLTSITATLTVTPCIPSKTLRLPPRPCGDLDFPALGLSRRSV